MGSRKLFLGLAAAAFAAIFAGPVLVQAEDAAAPAAEAAAAAPQAEQAAPAPNEPQAAPAAETAPPVEVPPAAAAPAPAPAQ